MCERHNEDHKDLDLLRSGLQLLAQPNVSDEFNFRVFEALDQTPSTPFWKSYRRLTGMAFGAMSASFAATLLLLMLSSGRTSIGAANHELDPRVAAREARGVNDLDDVAERADLTSASYRFPGMRGASGASSARPAPPEPSSNRTVSPHSNRGV